MSADPDYSVNVGDAPAATPSAPVPASEPAPPSPTPSGTTPADGPPENRIPYARFQEVTHANRELREANARVQAELELVKRQLGAMTGLQPQPQVDPQEQQIREALERMYPALKRIGDVPFDRLAELADLGPQMQAAQQAQYAAQQAQYDALADTTVAALYQGAKDIFGGKDLTGFQQRALHRAFVDFVESDDRNTTRYVRRDGALVADFLKLYAAEMLDPARRQAAVAVGQRVSRAATVPTGGGSSGPVGTPPPAVPKDADDLHDAAWTALRAKLGG